MSRRRSGPHSAVRSLRAAAAAFAVTLAVALSTSGPALAQASSIKVIVDDTAITSMDIAGRARLLQLAGKLSAGAAQKAAQEELVDDALRFAEGKRRGITVPDAAVESALSDIAGRSKMTVSQFGQALGQAGIPIKTLRERIRAQMVWGRIVRAKVQQTARTEQNDLIAQMRRQESGAPDPASATASDYVLQRVVFAVSAKAPAAEQARRRKEAESLRTRFKGCESGIPLAKSLKEVAVINVGRRLASEVPQQMAAALKDTPEGGLTKPEATPMGLEMYAVCEKIVITGENAAMANAMDAEALSSQGQTVSESLLRDLRQKANIVYR